MFDRHEKVQSWVPPAALYDRLNLKRFKKPAAFMAELIHAKVTGLRNILYVHDVIAHDGQILCGWTLEKRLTLLRELYPDGKIEETHRDLGDGLRIARSFKTNFLKYYNDIIGNPEDEGVVLKRIDSVLLNPLKNGLNGGWQLKVRRPHKNYAL